MDDAGSSNAQQDETDQGDIIADKMDEQELGRSHRAASLNNRAWHSLVPSKRQYQDLHEEEIDEDVDGHYVQSQYRRQPPDGPRKRGRPRKFPPGMPPSEYLNRMQQKVENEIDFEDETSPSLNQRSLHSRPTAGPGRGGSTVRLSQSYRNSVPAVGQAAHIAAQRLPTLGGGTPKDNKPLKVVALLPNSRRVGGAPRPVVSAVRTLGQPPTQRSRLPQLSIEKQAEQIINQTIKLGDKLISGQSLSEFNRLVDQLNGQITTLQDDNRKLNGLYMGLLEFKDNRIKQLENHVERLQSELAVVMKNWQAQLVVAESNSAGNKDDVEEEHIELQQRQNIEPPPRQATGWVIQERIMRPGENGEMTEEIIEQEVDEETFLRVQEQMQNEMMHDSESGVTVHTETMEASEHLD